MYISFLVFFCGKIAKEADFFSFGTNDLTQMTFGYSRDDVGKFLPIYLAKGILQNDPFEVGGVSHGTISNNCLVPIQDINSTMCIASGT